MSRHPNPSAIPDVILERFRLGELPMDVARQITVRAATDPILDARLGELVRSDATIRNELGPKWLSSAVADRASTKSFDRPVTRLTTWAAAAAIVLITVTILPPLAGWRPWRAATPTLPGPEMASPDRIKGDAVALMIYRSTGGSSEALADGDAAATGDLVRVAYRASEARFGIIISIDGRGLVTRHLPVTGESAIALRPGEVVPLPNAYELDDAPRWERFFLISSEKPFDVGPVIDAAQKATAGVIASHGEAPTSLTLPVGLEQTSFLLRKTS